ncbi:MAG: virulence RhuM family protein [Gammaproteobacteria bacterium]|nr:virulence RhuM family protein [Gammaproteobacteria bacterium]
MNLDVKLENDTIWLTQKQLAILFVTERSVIAKHLNNVFKTNELCKKTVCAKSAHTAEDGKTYQTQFYNLDAIISVGYRVNSKRGTEFRIWATNVLKQHIVNGYTVNEQRLNELKQTLKLVTDISERKSLSSDEATNLLQTISHYVYALDLLDDYDHQRVTIENITKTKAMAISYKEVLITIHKMQEKFGASALFGKEKDESLKSSLRSIMQSFDGKDVYPSLEEKAANLLYFLVKNHSFVDGNKRIAAVLFLRFLEKNEILYHDDGKKRIADNALVAITLMIAESRAEEKAVITAMVANLINRKN